MFESKTIYNLIIMVCAGIFLTVSHPRGNQHQILCSSNKIDEISSKLDVALVFECESDSR